MRWITSAKSLNFIMLLLIGFLGLLIPFTSNAQVRSAAIDLEGTQWLGQSLSQANVDGSTTILYVTYAFGSQGKVSLTILISKGVGITTTATPFGSLPYSTASSSIGTYNVSGKSISIDLPDRAINATVSGNVLKGVLTAKSNDQKEDWLAEKFIPENRSSGSVSKTDPDNINSSASGNNYSAPADSPMIGTWKYQDGCTTTGFGGFTSTSCNRTSTYIFSTDGNIQAIHIINFSPQSGTGNWKYTADGKTSGVLEEFNDNKLVEKGTVKFLSKSQIQYTITFSSVTDIIGKTYLWNKQ